MNNEVEFDIFTFDYQEDDEKNNLLTLDFEMKIYEELKKIAIESCFISYNRVYIYIDEKVEGDGASAYILHVYGKEKEILFGILDDTIKTFVKKNYEFYNGTDQLESQVRYIVSESLNSGDKLEEYWCSTSPKLTTIFSEKHKFEMEILVFNKEKLNRFIFEDKRHQFIDYVRREWENSIRHDNSININYDEIFRHAVSTSTRFLYFHIGKINALSALKYENATNYGSILSISEEVERKYSELECNYDIIMRFHEPVEFQSMNFKKIRKLLEMTNEELSLLLNDKFEFIGLGKMIGNPNCTYHKVVFSNFMEWAYSINGKQYMYFRNFVPCLPNNDFSFGEENKKLLKKTFDNMCDMENLLNIIEIAKKQKHGTMLVIAENAESESKRMAGSAIVIEPQVISGEMTELVSSIDGAILCAPNGMCYAIGVILDGVISKEADASRWARYNSALRYIELQKQNKKKTFVMVVSEDKYLNCFSTESQNG